MANSHRKGARTERELVNKLHEAGFAVIRAPASGAATERELPDVLCGNGAAAYAIEAKSSSGDPIYVSKTELDDLRYFATSFGCYSRVGARFNREDWAFFNPNDLHETEKSRRVKKEDLPDGSTIDDLRTDPFER